MNLFANNTGREAISQPAPPEPYVARRAVRYAAADNAQAALQRQFPGMSFGATAPIAVTEQVPAMLTPVEIAPVEVAPMEQAMPVSRNPIEASLNGDQDEFTQAA